MAQDIKEEEQEKTNLNFQVGESQAWMVKQTKGLLPPINSRQ
jgi:hypothetical protein